MPCLEDPPDRGAWRATVHRFAQSQHVSEATWHTRVKEAETRNGDARLLSPSQCYMYGEIESHRYIRYFCLKIVQSDNCVCHLPIPSFMDF